ncbi:MAG: sugar transferase [Kiritimatiellae bacterium]|nr:sugar transferase [Kiritimatiellia bacterium]
MNVWLCNPFDNLPEEGGRRQRYALLGRELVAHGHAVVWWTSDFRHATKTHRPFPSTFENADGVNVRLVATPPYKTNISFARIRSHAAFARNWFRDACTAVDADRLPRPDKIVVSLPPLGTAERAFKMRERWHCPVLVDVQDAWPETFYQLFPPLFRFLHSLRPLERRTERALRDADGVSAVSGSHLEWAERNGAANVRHLAYLGIEPGTPPARKPTQRPRLVYIGNMGRSYDLSTVIEAAKETGWSLDLAGTGPTEAALRKQAEGAPNITFHGFLPEKEVREQLAHATVGIVPMFDASCVAVPNKAADYAAAGLPIVTSLDGELRRLLETYKAGAAYPAGDVAAFRRAVEALPADSGEHARTLALEQFDAGKIYPAFAAFVERCTLAKEIRTGLFSKRVFDLVLVLATAPIWLALIAATALAVRIAMGSPVLFRQERAGLAGRPFTLLKFRTMRDGEGTDEERLTRFGRFLRSTSLDELPELWNVLRGEMSLVGPRPLHTRYLPRYNARQTRRHETLPGLTGWAQVHGRNALSWEEKFAYDLWYVEHRRLALDIAILFRTVATVFSRKGIQRENEATTSEFKGTQEKET